MMDKKCSVQKLTSFLFLALVQVYQVIGQETATPTQNTPSIISHPATFGRRWTQDVTVWMHTVNINLCDDTVKVSTNTTNTTDINGNIFDTTANLNSFDDHDIALLYNPSELTGHQTCSYATIAKMAETIYPTARYLLVAVEQYMAMTKSENEADSDLFLATITYEDAELVQNRFVVDENATIVSSGMVLVHILGTARSIFDVDEYVATSQDIGLWVLLTRVASCLSILGSLYVIYNLIGTKDRNKNMKSLFNRLLLGISVSDILSSVATAVAIAAFPSTPPGDYEGNYSQARWDSLSPGARGTHNTCAIQGMLVQFGMLGSTLFTGFVAIQTILVVRYRWTQRQMRKVEKLFFTVGTGAPLITGIWAVIADVLHPLVVGFCWINEMPQECGLDIAGPLIEEYCDDTYRGGNYAYYQLGFAVIWILSFLILVIWSMISLYLFVRRQEKQAARWSQWTQDGQRQRKVLSKASFYIGVYVFIWVPVLITLSGRGDPGTLSFRLIPFVAFVMPLQGFFNALIYSGVPETLMERLCVGMGSKWIGLAPLTSFQADRISALASKDSGKVSLKQIHEELSSLDDKDVISTDDGDITSSHTSKAERTSS